MVYVNPELQRLRLLVEAAWSAKLHFAPAVEGLKCGAKCNFALRRKFLEMLVRHGEEEAAQVKEEYRQASARTEQDYEETAAAMAEKKELTAGIVGSGAASPHLV